MALTPGRESRGVVLGRFFVPRTPPTADERSSEQGAASRPLEVVFPWLDPARQPRRALSVWAAAYASTLLLGLAFFVPDTGYSALWPAAGVAFLWLTTYAAQPTRVTRSSYVRAIALVGALSLVGNLIVGNRPVLALAFCVGSMIQAVVAAELYQRFRGSRGWLVARPASFYALFGAALLAALVSLPFGPAIVAADYGNLLMVVLFFVRTTSDVLGVGIVGLTFLSPRDPYDRARGHSSLLFIATLGTIGALAFTLARPPQYSFGFIAIPVVIWVASRHSARHTAVFTTVIALAMSVATLLGYGPFSRELPLLRSAFVHALDVVMYVMAMNLCLGAAERNRLTGRIEAQRERARSQANMLATIITSMGEGIVVVDQSGSVRLINDAATDLLGLDPDVFDLVGAAGEVPARFALDGFDVTRIDVPVHVPGSDSPRVIAVQAHPIEHEGEGGAVLILRDITEDKRRTDELRTFARVVAHDLLNPLAAADLWRETLEVELEAERPGLGAEALSEIGAASDRMRQFITDLLAYNVARDGSLELVQVDLHELLESVVSGVLGSYPPEQRPTITTEVSGRVVADRGQLRQVVANLVQNACKYSLPDKAATVRIWSTMVRPGWLALNIDDDGIGVPTGMERQIFEEFFRAPAVGGRAPGAGLGLAICKRIMDRHGGQIRAQRRPEGGSRFTIELSITGAVSPTPQLAETAATWPAAASSSGRPGSSRS